MFVSWSRQIFGSGSGSVTWPIAIARDLPRCIDSRFRTIPTRDGRALIGLSAGGFGAFNVGLRHLATFAAVESWSGYFAATDPTGLRTLNLGSERANRKGRVPRGPHLDAKLTRRPTFIAFFAGRQDTRFLTANMMLDEAFTEHHIPHIFKTYQGGHSESLWRQQAPLWLGWHSTTSPVGGRWRDLSRIVSELAQPVQRRRFVRSH